MTACTAREEDIACTAREEDIACTSREEDIACTAREEDIACTARAKTKPVLPEKKMYICSLCCKGRSFSFTAREEDVA